MASGFKFSFLEFNCGYRTYIESFESIDFIVYLF